MTRDEYYALLKERWEQTDKTSREAIHEYNEWRRALRQELEMESPGTPLTPPLQKAMGNRPSADERQDEPLQQPTDI